MQNETIVIAPPAAAPAANGRPSRRRLSLLPVLVLAAVPALCLLVPALPAGSASTGINAADTAWMLTATALVLIMTPGLAFFYGGMVNKKNVLSTMLQSFICMVVITMLWVMVGFSLSFGDSVGGVVGDPRTFFMLRHVFDGAPFRLAPTIPLVLFVIFQLKFAIVTPALITGAFAERIRFSSYLLFIVLFSLFIYCPLAHATWHPGGLLAQLGVLDFAGGTVVHMSAGWAALASALYMKKRAEPVHNPARITYVLLGTGLLWFGWFGFNAGSAFAANGTAAIALATTTTASAAAAFGWIVFDAARGKKMSAMGTCIGAVVGLVAITPAAGFVTIPHSILIGLGSAVVSNIMVILRSRTNIDDTLDVFPCHGMGGITGMLLTGVFAHKSVNSMVSSNGLFFGETRLFLVQLGALVGVSVFAFGGTLLLLKITDAIKPLRVSDDEERIGLDQSQHGERL
ncbi:ammonium transporter [Flaviaesturariibacter flavus]|uniref:Ammonium transporter n=1 Tax=Flaviaesturariibacter flavus TaxID=2502780 RepID=A0A4R1B7Y7_9BACT|nr:ammonium transporter [Flaviaesturariibacter flavus]TCJ12063.1 ammonium transporter [Flaviaesturariibacter flavus]